MKRLNKQKGMYALLIAVAALIGVSIYGSCSADEDYDGYSSKDELFTLADGEMGRSDAPPMTCHKTGLLTASLKFDFIHANPLYNPPTYEPDTLYYKLNTYDFENFSYSDTSTTNHNIIITKITPTLEGKWNNNSYIIKIDVEAERFLFGEPNPRKDKCTISDTLQETEFYIY